jgi:PKD repeat protein
VSSISVPAHGAVIVLDNTSACTLSCNANAPTSATVGKLLTFNASSTVVGCSGTPTYSWSFGDGATGTGTTPKHAYAAAGLFTWTVTVSVSGKTCPKSGTVNVTALPTTPVIGALTRGSAPFRITVTGGNLQKGIKVYINSVLWTNVSWVSKLKIVINGGNALKLKVPKNTPTSFKFVNPDAGSTTVTWSWH